MCNAEGNANYFFLPKQRVGGGLTLDNMLGVNTFHILGFVIAIVTERSHNEEKKLKVSSGVGVTLHNWYN